MKHDWGRNLIYTAIGRKKKVMMPHFGRSLLLQGMDEGVSESTVLGVRKSCVRVIESSEGGRMLINSTPSRSLLSKWGDYFTATGSLLRGRYG